MSIPRSAQRDEGTYNLQFSILRTVDIAPKEPFHKDLRELSSKFNLDPAFLSDLDLIQRLLDQAADPAAFEEAWKKVLHPNPEKKKN
ncbi:MAG: hypothetical protein HY717_14965 [Planctomycetes bacterium]|nr:hypothetical protein [Planctomycetota bacterium]